MERHVALCRRRAEVPRDPLENLCKGTLVHLKNTPDFHGDPGLAPNPDGGDDDHFLGEIH
jgi:hypothetical protein